MVVKVNSAVIVFSLVILVISFWNRNDLPKTTSFVTELLDEPRQIRTQAGAFYATYNDVDYRVEPEYEYDLHGLVVSFRHHDDNSRMHFLANDHLNMMDVCVVWGDSATSDKLGRINFWNGIFTCNVRTGDNEAWAAFSMQQLSNNHLISADEAIRDQVKAIRVGDQIRVRGYLASYSSETGGKRGTSTTRTDTGDGACETVFVEKFEIVQAGRSAWRQSMWVSLLVLLLGLIVHFKRPYRPYRDNED
jgi:hypothetical protein